MKKILMTILIVVLAVGFIGASCEPDVTFEQVSQPYLDEYGVPDDIVEFSDDYICWTWDLGDRMLSVRFSDLGEDWGGWYTDGEYYWKTFGQVSKPYLDKYGEPEDVYEYSSSGWWLISWWWWSKGFSVDFSYSSSEYKKGWVVDSTYSFTPF